MILEPEEQGFLGSSAAGEDLNHDGKITIDEIVMHHSGGATATATVASLPASAAAATASTSTSSDSGRSGERDREHFRDGGYGRHDGGPSSDSRSKTDDPMAKRVLTGTAGGTGKDADKRHSYRFSKATDKLPTGLPSWFTSRDTNKDGQVSMSEYSRSVSESMVSEFRRFDTNDDGIITAKEAARQK
jgi:EF hand